MSAKDGFENNIMKHIFQNASIPSIGDASGLQPSAAAGSLYVALYTVTPSDSASGNECDYDGYARVGVARTASGFAVSGNTVTNASALAFPQCVSGNADVAVGFSLNTDSVANVDDAILWGALSSNLTISQGTTPRFEIGDLTINVD
jgi:hypothetical protein